MVVLWLLRPNLICSNLKKLEILGIPESERDLRQQFVIYSHGRRGKEGPLHLPTQQKKSTDL